MRPHHPRAVFALSTLLWSVPAAAAPVRLLPAEPGWFYANAQGDRGEVSATGTFGGQPVWRTGVVLARVVDATAAGAVAKTPGLHAVTAHGPDGLVLALDFGPEADDLALSRSLYERDDVVWSHPDLAFIPTAHDLPDDPYVEAQWHLENTGQSGGTVDADIDAEPAWALATGAGTVVSVIDSGVDPDHPDLRVTCGYNYIEDSADCYPANGNAHGTAAAGLIGAIGNNGVGVAGVAFDADIYGVRLIGGATTYVDIYDACVESVDAGAAVLNNSWGYGDGCGSYSLPGAIREGFQYADTVGRGGLGSVIVFSAGNGNCDMGGDGIQSHPTVVSVAALDRNDRKEGYSSFGQWMDIAGPSGGLLTTDITGDDGYGSYEGDNNYTPNFSGTSASAPVVSGVLALMFSANPDLTADDARAVLCATADMVQVGSAGYDSRGWSEVYGCGRVNAAAAVVAVANTGPGAPVPLGPTADPYADRVVLQWDPASDPDGDPLRYALSVTITSPDDAEDSGLDTGGSVAEPTVYEWDDQTGLLLDITELVGAGDSVSWTVQASDAWTSSDAVEGPGFTVQPIPDPPEEPEEPEEPEDTTPPATDTASVDERRSEAPRKGGGCATLGGAGAGLAWLVVAVAARRRSRPEHVAPGEVDPGAQDSARPR